jgi:ABC-type lipoprotein export system ATPase subunit
LNPVTIQPEIAREAIHLSRVVKQFKNAAGVFTVLKGIDLLLKQGEFVSVVGKSGSGKSTLLNMITGIDHPTSGEVLINGTNIYSMNESERALWRGKTLGVVFQFFQLLPMLTLLENVMLPMDFVGNYEFDERPKRAMELLKMVGLEQFAHKLPVAVSNGQQQSAAIARALANEPPIIVADEPTGNLDSRSAESIITLFDQLAKSGKTIAMVTHDPSLTERTTRTVIISDGELINETVAYSLPLLSHNQMMAATRQIERITYKSSQTIIHQGEHVPSFYMIEDGAVDIVLHGPTPEEVTIARLGKGEFFGEVELMKGGRSIATVRAANTGEVSLAALPRDRFMELLKESPLTEGTLASIVHTRIEQNRIADQRMRRRN